MSLVIASQMEEFFNTGLAACALAPTVIPVPVGDPWSAARDADILIVRPGPGWKPLRATARPEHLWPGRLRWVFTASTGVDIYPGWLLDAPLVSCGRGTANDDIADYVIAAIYLQAKDLESARVHGPEEWRHMPLGRVVGSTVGLLGLGAIGRAVATRAVALGAHVVAARRRTGGDDAPAGVTIVPTMEEVVAQSDHIVIALPGTPQTQGAFNADLFAKVKPGAHLINIARGSVVDQQALLDALDHGQLGFATLDVTEPEPLPAGHRLYTHPCVRLTPHTASNFTAVRGRLLAKFIGDLERFARGDLPGDVIDPLLGY